MSSSKGVNRTFEFTLAESLLLSRPWEYDMEYSAA